MSLSEQADEITRSIDDYRKQIGDVAAENAHVKRFQFLKGRILAAKPDWAIILTEKLNLALYDNRGSCPTHAIQSFRSGKRLQSKRRQNVGAKDGSIRSDIYQERHLYP